MDLLSNASKAAKRYTLSEVVKRTGAKRRSVQLWTDGGVINAVWGTDRAGTGVHREIDGIQLRVVALLVPLADIGIPIGVLKIVSAMFFEAFAFGVLGDFGNPPLAMKIFDEKAPRAGSVWPILERAERGIGRNYFVLGWSADALSWTLLADENGPIRFDPVEFQKDARGKRGVVMMLDLNERLHAICD